MAHPDKDHRREELARQREHEARQAEFATEYERTHGLKAAPGAPENKKLDQDVAVPENKAQRKAAPTKAELRDMSKADLYEMAQERDIEGRSGMSKSELVEALAR